MTAVQLFYEPSSEYLSHEYVQHERTATAKLAVANFETELQ